LSELDECLLGDVAAQIFVNDLDVVGLLHAELILSPLSEVTLAPPRAAHPKAG